MGREVQPIWKTYTPPKPKRRTLKTKPEPLELRAAKLVVAARCRNECEARTPWCEGPPTQVHHRAGRGFDGCHDPLLLLAVCGMGNTTGCHGWLHQNRKRAEAHGGMLPKGTTADQLDEYGQLRKDAS